MLIQIKINMIVILWPRQQVYLAVIKTANMELEKNHSVFRAGCPAIGLASFPSTHISRASDILIQTCVNKMAKHIKFLKITIKIIPAGFTVTICYWNAEWTFQLASVKWPLTYPRALIMIFIHTKMKILSPKTAISLSIHVSMALQTHFLCACPYSGLVLCGTGA